jgi:hypothetical protein
MNIENFSDMDWSGSEWIVNPESQSFYLLIHAGESGDDKREEYKDKIETAIQFLELAENYIKNTSDKYSLHNDDYARYSLVKLLLERVGK